MNGEPALVKKCPSPESISVNRDLFTRQENRLDKNWLEKMKEKPGINLESIERVKFVRCGGKGHERTT